MHTVKLKIEDSVFDKVIYFLKNLPQNEVEIIENVAHDDWTYFEDEIDKGLNSGISGKSHSDIVNDIKKKYV